jgi:SAM-dependent methyltransferase
MGATVSAARGSTSTQRDFAKAALRGEPSYVWRAGQERRLSMILSGAGDRLEGLVLDNGCGVGAYVVRLSQRARRVIGLEYDLERAGVAHDQAELILNGAGEALPFPDSSISFILSHEVLEHVSDDRMAVAEMVRVLTPGGRLALFVPNRGYPFETHGIYWRNEYHFGNIPLINYLPRSARDRLAPHVRIYSTKDLERLLSDLPISIRQRTIIFGAYDNVIARYPRLGRGLRKILQGMERTPLRIFGLSHFWVIEKTNG